MTRLFSPEFSCRDGKTQDFVGYLWLKKCEALGNQEDFAPVDQMGLEVYCYLSWRQAANG
ncbi:MAG: hypothetical protein R3E93_02785 [Thiothrix sp.]